MNERIKKTFWASNFALKPKNFFRRPATGDAPTTSEWSTISLPMKVHLISEVWWYITVVSNMTWPNKYTYNTIQHNCTYIVRCDIISYENILEDHYFIYMYLDFFMIRSCTKIWQSICSCFPWYWISPTGNILSRNRYCYYILSFLKYNQHIVNGNINVYFYANWYSSMVYWPS